MSNDDNPALRQPGFTDEPKIFNHITAIIENRKSRAAAHANCEVTLMYWELRLLFRWHNN